MVKKSSLFQKLKNRWRAGTVQVDEEPVRRGRPAPLATPAGRPGNGGRVQALAEVGEPIADARSGRKLNSREEAMATLGEGFKELCTLMRGVQVRIEAQGDKGKAQAEALQRLTLALEKQGQTQETLARALGSLPETMAGVKGALERAAATDDRTAKTLGEFRSTMERVQGSMAQMVEQSKQQSTAADRLLNEQKSGSERLAKVLESRAKDGDLVQGAVQRLEKTSADHMTALRLAQQDQATRMHKLVAESSTWNKAVLAVLVLTFCALAGIFFVMLSGR